MFLVFFFFQAEDGIRDRSPSRGLGDVYKRQALTDETIQLFSPGRSSQVLDVWLDFMGVLAGLLVGLFLLALCRMCALLYKHRNED